MILVGGSMNSHNLGTTVAHAQEKAWSSSIRSAVSPLHFLLSEFQQLWALSRFTSYYYFHHFYDRLSCNPFPTTVRTTPSQKNEYEWQVVCFFFQL